MNNILERSFDGKEEESKCKSVKSQTIQIGWDRIFSVKLLGTANISIKAPHVNQSAQKLSKCKLNQSGNVGSRMFSQIGTFKNNYCKYNMQVVFYLYIFKYN